jgi:hypothetical protein
MASGTEDEKNTGFTLTDRHGVGDGDPDGAKAGTGEPSPSAGAYPPVDFHTFVLSLGSSALFHMGELDSPDGQPGQIDLPLAKHTIDVIAMLEEKTKGNLTAPEANLVESLLYDLRLRYVEKSKA